MNKFVSFLIHCFVTDRSIDWSAIGSIARTRVAFEKCRVKFQFEFTQSLLDFFAKILQAGCLRSSLFNTYISYIVFKELIL